MQANEASKSVGNQLYRFFELSQDMLCIASADGYFKRVNPAFTQALGWNSEEMLARPFLDFVHPDDQAATLSELERQIIADEKSIYFENRYLHRDGSWRLLSWVSAPGQDGLMFATARDITASRKAERRMARSIRELNDFKAALDAHAIVATTDARGMITYANDKFSRISKYAREELIGQNHRIINSGQHPEAFFKELWQTIRSGNIWQGEIKNRAKDGTFYWVDTTIVPFLDEQGVPVQYIAIRTDISGRKRAEQKLVVARDEAQQANRAKDSFLATMSHEIRTPLAGMLGMLEVLSLSTLDPEQKEMLKVAWDSSRSLLRIVNDILDWSKIEEGKMQLEPRAASIQQLLQEVANTYSRVASTKSLVLRQHIDARLAAAHVVDSLRLSQIMNNFVSNAIKFTHHGGVELRAELLEQLDGGERIRLSVRDTGVGIAEEIQQRLFQRYQQGGVDTARLYGGTGLGLAICERLAKLMDGRIELESVPGKGTTFSLTLALQVSSDPVASTLRSHYSDVEQRTVHPLFGSRADAPLVLAVDDHPTNRDLLARQLKLLGLRVETAMDGDAALSLWREGRFAVVITDCHMPQMDGFSLSRAIRKIEAEGARPRTPIIAWTANALADEAALCHAADMDELLVKPADMAQLKALLAKWLPFAARQQFDEEGRAVAGPIDYAEFRKIVPARSEQITVLHDFRSHFLADRIKLAEMLVLCDLAQLERRAHRMKGSSRMVGARALSGVCAAIEQAARNGELEGMQLQMTRLDEALAQFEDHLASTLMDKI